MALGSVLAAALTDHSARTWSLTIAGVDMAKAPGGAGVGIDPSTVTVFESGPGGASSIAFTIDDPNLAVTISDGDPVTFWDLVNDRPEFAGWVQAWTPAPAFGTGRQIVVRGIGVDALLDWVQTPAVTFADQTLWSTAVAQIVAASSPIGPLRVAFPAPAAGLNSGSTQATPTGRLYMTFEPRTQDPAGGAASQSIAGGTLREALRQLAALSWATGLGSVQPIPGFLAWVDPWFGLRCTTELLTDLTLPPNPPVDMANRLVVTDTAGSSPVAANLSPTTDATGIPRAVVVTGAGGVSATVSDGTGKIGPTAAFTDSSLTTAAKCAIAGAAYLSGFRVAYRGEFDLENYNAPANRVYRPGAYITLTDAQVGIPGLDYRIASIRKTYAPSGPSWHIAFGGRPPALTAAVRRLTRGATA